MKGQIIEHLGIQIYKEIAMPDGGIIVQAEPVEDRWRSLDLANHNVFRLDADVDVIWQVKRVESPTRASWEKLHQMAKENDPTTDGYYDPFWTLGLDETNASTSEPKGVYRPGCAVFLQLAEYRMMCSPTYALDVDTGVATFLNANGWYPASTSQPKVTEATKPTIYSIKRHEEKSTFWQLVKTLHFAQAFKTLTKK